MKQLVGGCLQAVGIMIAGLTGLCSLMVLGAINSWQSLSAAFGAIIIYAIPLAIGAGLIFAGRALIRSAREDGY